MSDNSNGSSHDTSFSSEGSTGGAAGDTSGDSEASNPTQYFGLHDPEAQFRYMEEALAIREQLDLTSNRALDKNLSYVLNTDVVAVSGEFSPEKTIPTPTDDARILTSPDDPNAFHSEVKILEHYAAKSEKVPLNLFTETEPCSGCQETARRYQEMFGDESLILEWYLARYQKFVI